jgi:O-antigen ligase
VYIAVVFIGAPLSVNAPLTIYRGIELTSMLVVIAGARRSVGIEATRRLGDLLYWFSVALVGTVWLGVALFPSEAIKTFLNQEVRWNFQISGVFPEISSNGVGILAVVVAVWSFTRTVSGRTRPIIGYPIAIVSVATLIAAQYRTGYAALIVASLVWLWVRRQWGWLTVAAAASSMVVFFASSTIASVAPYVLRGTAEQAAGLSSRTYWWSAAIPVWESSPFVGRGLLTGTRYEVLEPLGLTTTSSIHSTWIEALVGTGIVGVALLVASLGVVLVWAGREARRPGGVTTALMILVVLSVRSFTGSTFETFSLFAVIYVWIASSAEEWPRSRSAVVRPTAAT